MRRLTTHDIARKAGVNQSTVSRVLSDVPLISAATIAKVRKACRELDYVPNVLASGLRSCRSRVLAVHIPFGAETVLADPFLPRFLSGVSRVSAARGYGVFLAHADGGRTDLCALVRSGRADGVILTSPSRRDPRVRALARDGIPCVLGRYGGRLSPRMRCVDIDNRHTGYVAGRFLLGRGHRTIGLITEDPARIVAHDFHAGFAAALREAGVEADEALWQRTPVTYEGAYRATGVLLADARVPTAIVTDTALTVFGALKAVAEQSAEVTVLGVESPLLAFLYPRLPRIRSPFEELGARMSEALIDLLEGRPVAADAGMLQAQIVEA
jgi:DNA-binding LacI/PurR family transcriptional regulator